MNLKIVWGTSSKDKSRYLYKEAWKRKNINKKTIILVPEQYTLEAERALLEMSEKEEGMIQIQVMSIKRLMNWIFSSVKNPKAEILDSTGKILLIKSILKKHKDELILFDRAAAMPGFSAAVGDFVSDLKKFNVSSEDLFKAADKDKDSLIYRKAHDVKLIMNYYSENSKKIKAIDNDDSIDLLCEIIDEGSQRLKNFFDETSVYFDSFDYIPAKNIQLIFSILPFADDVSVSINVDEERKGELYAAGADSIKLIENIAEEYEIKPDYIQIEENSENIDYSIQFLRKNLFSYSNAEYDKSSDIHITKALGRNEEVEYAASRILQLVNEKKYKFGEISVICSNMEKYSSYVSRIFRQYNIPFFLDERRKVTSHPVVVWLLSAMQFADSHLREYLIDMIKTLYTPLNQDECEELEDYCIVCSIQGSLFTRDFKRGAKIFNLKKLNEMRKAVIKQVLGFDTGKKNAAGWAIEIYKLLEHAEIISTINGEKIRLEKLGRLDEAAETAQSWNVIINILDQLNTISTDEILELDDIIDLLTESFLNVQIGILPTGINNVIVGDVGRSKAASVKCSFILGANEGLFPAPMAEGAIFTDNELSELKQKGVTAGRDKEFRKSESSFNLFSAVTAPEKMLNISYDCSNGGESALIVERIKSLFPNIITESAYIDPMVSPTAAFSASAKALGAIGDSRPYNDGTWKEGMASLMKSKQYAENIDKMYNFAAGGSIHHNIMQTKDGNLVASVSQLEQYAKCPFAYMISYGLYPADNPSPDILNVSSGAYLHKVMEEFGKELDKKDIYAMTDDELDILMQKKAKHIAAVFEDGAFLIDAKREFLSNQLIQTARRSGQVYVKGIKQSGFTPIAHEMTFDIGRDFGPIKIELPDGKNVFLRGKIDRVDKYTIGDEKWFRAVDYKSGRKSIDLTGIMTGENLQLFVYANALKENIDAKAAGVFYFPLRNDYTDEEKDRSDVEKLNGIFVDNANVINGLDTSIDAGGKSEIVNLRFKKDKSPYKSEAIKTRTFFEAALKASMNTAKDLCVMMDAGDMQVNPIADKNTSACAYCDYQNICRFGAQVYEQNQIPSDIEVETYINSFAGGDENEVD